MMSSSWYLYITRLCFQPPFDTFLFADSHFVKYPEFPYICIQRESVFLVPWPAIIVGVWLFRSDRVTMLMAVNNFHVIMYKICDDSMEMLSYQWPGAYQCNKNISICNILLYYIGNDGRMIHREAFSSVITNFVHEFGYDRVESCDRPVLQWPQENALYTTATIHFIFPWTFSS